MKGGLGSVIVAAIRPLIELLLALMLVAMLGSAGYGEFSFAIVVITFLAIPVQSGLPILVVRQTAASLAKGQSQSVKGLWEATTAIALGYCALVIAVVGGVVFMFSWLRDVSLNRALIWSSALMPLLVLLSVEGSKLRGLGRPVQGQVGDQIARPLFFAILVLAVWQIPVDLEIDPDFMLQVNILAALLALTLTRSLLSRNKVYRKLKPLHPKFAWKLWLRSLLPFAMIGGVQILGRQTDILVIGMIASDESVGIYRVTAHLATLALLVLQAVGYTLSPYFARLFLHKDLTKLQRFVTLSAQVSLCAGLSVFAVYWVFGETILTKAFGPEFQDGHNALLILAFGHVISGFFGPVGFLLTMTGYEKDVFLVLTVSAALNVLLNFLLVPTVGIEGAAVATTVGMLVWNVGFWRIAKTKLQVRSTAIAL